MPPQEGVYPLADDNWSIIFGGIEFHHHNWSQWNRRCGRKVGGWGSTLLPKRMAMGWYVRTLVEEEEDHPFSLRWVWNVFFLLARQQMVLISTHFAFIYSQRRKSLSTFNHSKQKLWCFSDFLVGGGTEFWKKVQNSTLGKTLINLKTFVHDCT